MKCNDCKYNQRRIKMGFISKIFGSYSEREVKRIRPLVDKINGLRDTKAALSD